MSKEHVWTYVADYPTACCLPEDWNQFLRSSDVQSIFPDSSTLSHEIARHQTFLKQLHLVPATSMELDFKVLFGSHPSSPEKQTEFNTETRAIHQFAKAFERIRKGSGRNLFGCSSVVAHLHSVFFLKSKNLLRYDVASISDQLQTFCKGSLLSCSG